MLHEPKLDIAALLVRNASGTLKKETCRGHGMASVRSAICVTKQFRVSLNLNACLKSALIKMDCHSHSLSFFLKV